MSAAVGSDRISAVVGYALIAGDFSESSPNLPQRIAVNCEANTDNQGDLDTSEWQATSLKAVGDRYGYGSPAYIIARIILPVIGGIPLVFYPQAESGGATAKEYDVTPVGTATSNATHTLKISGRSSIDAQFFNFTVEKGDTQADIAEKIEDTISAVIGSPFSATSTEYEAKLTSKWKGLTANDLQVEVETNGNDAGITYTITSTADGAGTPSISTALDAMKGKWNTIVISSYGTNTDIMDAYEAWNGKPDPLTPTGQYIGTVMKPAIVITGSVAQDPSSITDARKGEQTIAIAPAPNSKGLPMEAAANMAALFAVIGQNNPERDVIYRNYPDMPAPDTIGAMADYNERDRIVKKGCSTVELVAGKYQVIDFVTTYHPDGELVPTYRYCRDLMVAFNIRYGYMLLETLYVKGKVIANDSDVVGSNVEVIKPASWKAILIEYFADLVLRGLCVDATFFKNSLSVTISATNPNRIDTSFRTKLSGIARISATENVIGFNFGSIS